VVQEVGQVFGFQAVCGPGEIGNVREEDSKFLALRSDLNALLAGEN
jgi:hypothetical protein